MSTNKPKPPPPPVHVSSHQWQSISKNGGYVGNTYVSSHQAQTINKQGGYIGNTHVSSSNNLGTTGGYVQKK